MKKQVELSTQDLSRLLCGFRECCSTQHSLLQFVETCKNAVDKGNVVGAILLEFLILSYFLSY